MNAKQKWLEGRQAGVGSSDSPVLALGEVFKKTPVDVYISKKRTVKPEDAEESDNPHLRRGKVYEPLAAALYEQQTGIKVYAPETDEERFGPYQVWDPDSPMFADFDGFCEDGWVLEIKSPMQRVADSFKASGIRDYYMIQSQHLAHVANVCPLPFLGADAEKWIGKVKGTRVVIYECENVALQIVELPIDKDIVDAIRRNAIKFWGESVVVNLPPAPTRYEQPPESKEKTKSKYTQMEGEAWQRAVDAYKLAKEREAGAKVAIDSAKKMIIGVLKEAKIEAVQIGRHKFLNRLVAGRKSFSKSLLQADFPDLDLTKYEVQGAGYVQFNYYGPKDRMKAEGDDESTIVTVQSELEEFAGKEWTIEEGVETFDELRSRADLYAAMLEMELGEVRTAIEAAAEAVTRKLG